MKRPPEQPLLKRLGWFVLLWIGGVMSVTILAYVVKALIPSV